MKKCRRCPKPATLHVTEVKDGQAVAVHLCESCAGSYLSETEGDDNQIGDDSADFAAKLGALSDAASDAESQNLKCSTCGLRFSEFRVKGRVGCADCYRHFRSELMPLLDNIHESGLHTGKRPAGGSGEADALPERRLAALRMNLQQAVQREDYEQAALLRDEIQSIESPEEDDPI